MKDLCISSNVENVTLPNFWYHLYAKPISMVENTRHRMASDISNNNMVVLNLDT
ncbi:conserved hypothetical protein [Ricinus communis]|uniref:Uncharacterized protein n=1 Tax=Ricinus communis TaxID=3988 RepID=B9S2Z6_RICCO|nr:conserved hypothetical protein [Ricinus communis]